MAVRAVRAHTIVLHGVEVQTHKVGQEKVILGEVPSPVADGHGVRVVGRRAGL